ncbi:hypothetical protein NFHSH190041_18410 [Shewanella sp. NFH-SH190041]|uniref:hypothetical protein n=1 Tax=Shewanella sp. NFH-SH190041 TaxID=2950245 RepID=UPI0021C3F6FA|nr:hypothetical protein [Shewanella sp. NFH-SH190041]BDM64389.1 hypothetical protein NFHSH190041_18410 [Shewanella sp. NFH-SH190041]
MNINEIHWHDSEIESVIEIPNKDELIYNIQYPEDWENNLFSAKSIIFGGLHSYTIEEMPFEGNPTILSALLIKEEGGYKSVKLETNAGNRYITFKTINLGNGHVSI